MRRSSLSCALAAMIVAAALGAHGEVSPAGTTPRPVSDSRGGLPAAAVGASTAVRSAAFPTAADIRRARLWIAGRAGFLGFAVIDSQGRLSGWHAGRQFISGSVTKAMLLVRYLRLHVTLTSAERTLLTRMIEVSDNDAADVIYRASGRDYGLSEVARLAHMRHFAASRGYWGYCLIEAADQAHFFLAMDRLIPRQHRAFAHTVLSHIVSWQSYGIPAVARPRWTVYFKGGWRTGLHGGRLLHQVARLERKGTVFAVAILTDGDPTAAYGVATLQGVTRRLLGK